MKDATIISQKYWSKLNIFAPSRPSLCNHASHEERDAGDSLSDLWRQAR